MKFAFPVRIRYNTQDAFKKGVWCYMKVRSAVSQAWMLYKKNFGQMMMFLLLEVVLRLIVLTPLLFLANPATRPLAGLSAILFILITLPARQCAAEVMQNAIRGESIFSVRLCITTNYWQKVWNGLKQSVLLLLWAIPFLLATGYALDIIYSDAVVGKTDVFSLMMSISSLGGGDIVTGVVRILMIYLCTFLPFLFGCAFHSGRRHERALGGKKLIPRHRGKLILAWLAGLVTIVPFVAVAGYVSLDYVRALIAAFSNMATGLVIPSFDQNQYIVFGAFIVLLLPFVPFKSLITACYVHGLWEGKE